MVTRPPTLPDVQNVKETFSTNTKNRYDLERRRYRRPTPSSRDGSVGNMFGRMEWERCGVAQAVAIASNKNPLDEEFRVVGTDRPRLPVGYPV
jgi:hypothetical protein